MLVATREEDSVATNTVAEMTQTEFKEMLEAIIEAAFSPTYGLAELWGEAGQTR